MNNDTRPRAVAWLWTAVASATLTAILHVVVLLASDLDPVSSPIQSLSRQPLGALHTLGLCLFGLAHVALAAAMARLDRGRLWPFARLLVLASGIALFYTAYVFARADAAPGERDADPLWLVATLIGLAMGAMQPGLSRRSQGLGLFSAVWLGIWLLLVPLILLVDSTWIGAYERIVGTTYVAWIVGVALGLLRTVGSEPAT